MLSNRRLFLRGLSALPVLAPHRGTSREQGVGVSREPSATRLGRWLGWPSQSLACCGYRF